MARNTIVVATDVACGTCSGSGPSYTVAYTITLYAIQVGDWVKINKREAGAGGSSTITSVYTYQVTGITEVDEDEDGEAETHSLVLKFISDTNGDGDDSPCDLPSGTGSSGSPNKAPHEFYRDLGGAFVMFVE